MLYLITDGNRIKIGTSKKPEQRLKQLQTGNGAELRLIGVFDLPNNYERRLHGILKGFRSQGEWFHLPPDGIPWLQQYVKELETAHQNKSCLYCIDTSFEVGDNSKSPS